MCQREVAPSTRHAAAAAAAAPCHRRRPHAHTVNPPSAPTNKTQNNPGLRSGTLDVAALEDAHRGLEQQLQRDSSALRALKDQNVAAKQALADAAAQIAALHQQFEQAMGDADAQLDGVERALEQFEATRPPPLEPLPAGPGQGECDALLAEEMARAKRLEAAIAGSEAAIAEAGAAARDGAAEVAALEGEAARLQALQADRAKAAGVDAHLARAAKWAGAAAAALEALGGVAIREIGDGFVALDLTTAAPEGLAPGAPLREERSVLTLRLRPGGGGGNGGGAQLEGAELAPPTVAVDDVVAAASAPGGGGVRAAVAGVQLRLAQHWRLQALVDAAAAKFTVGRVDGGGGSGGGSGSGGAGAGAGEAVFEAALRVRGGVKLVRVAAPPGWPAPLGAARPPVLRLAGASGEGVDAAALAAAVEADGALRGADLAGFLDGVSRLLEAQLA